MPQPATDSAFDPAPDPALDPGPDPVADSVVPLTTAYRVIRRLERPDSPFGGLLARSTGGEPVVLVDVAELRTWPGWTVSSAHVLSPIDVALTDRGGAVVLPWCAERVDRLLARRRAAAVPLAAGEAVTLAVSFVRGLAELAFARAAEPLPVGAWWLTADACPVFVHADVGVGVSVGATVAGSAAELLETIAELCSDRSVVRALRDVGDALVDPRAAARDVEKWEAVLFAAATAVPIETSAFAPARARDLSPTLGARGRFATAREPEHDDPVRRSALAPLIDAGLADLVSRSLATLARRLRERRRIAAWSVAAVVGATVLTAGLLWPEPAGTPAAAQPPATETAAPETAVAAPVGIEASPTSTPAAAAPGTIEPKSIESAVAELLSARTACGGDASCLGAVVENPAIDFPAGVIDAADAEREVTLLDEFGGAAVLRVDSTLDDRGQQLVVVVRSNDGWLLRDVHDVAEQSG